MDPINTFGPEQNGHFFEEAILKYTSWKKGCVFIYIYIPERLVPKGPIGKYVSIGLSNGLPNKQAITWSHYDPDRR